MAHPHQVKYIPKLSFHHVIRKNASSTSKAKAQLRTASFMMNITETGHFRPQSFPLAYASRLVVSGDFNGDGKDDLAAGEAISVTVLLTK